MIKRYYYGSDNKIIEYYDELIIDWIGVVENTVFVFIKGKALPLTLDLTKISYKRKKFIIITQNLQLIINDSVFKRIDRYRCDDITKRSLREIKNYCEIELMKKVGK